MEHIEHILPETDFSDY